MKFCVIGLGRFGFEVAVTLADNGMEVLAIDSNPSLISSISDRVTQAICVRIIDEDSLTGIGIDTIETVIVAMGENFAQSILVTALLKQRLRVPNVIARALNEIHKDILSLVGADQVVLPEQEMGVRLADRLSLPFKSIVRLTHDFSISEQPAPTRFVGRELYSLRLPEQYHVYCIGRKIGDTVQHLGDDAVIGEDDILLLAGSPKDLAKIARL